MPRGGEKFWPSEERVAELCARGTRIAEEVAAAGYDVIGDVTDLRPPVDVPPRRHPDSVTEAEMLEAATGVIAAMMTDVRRLTRQRNALSAPPPAAAWRRRVPEPVRTLAETGARSVVSFIAATGPIGDTQASRTSVRAALT